MQNGLRFAAGLVLAVLLIGGLTAQSFLGRVATDTLIGRDTAGEGPVEQLTVSAPVAFTGSGGVGLNGTTAQFNTALSDGSFATLGGTETLTGKTVNLTSNTLTGTTAQFNTALSDDNFATVSVASLASLVTIQGRTVTLADAGADAILGWDDTASAYENLTQSEVLAVIGSASATAQGVVELATESEVHTGTDTGRAVPVSELKPLEAFCYALSDETTDLTTAAAKLTARVPYGFELSEVRASVNTAPTGSTIIVDINEGGTTIMTTNKLSIDASEKTSETAATAPGITDSTLADDAEITFDIDQIGSTIAGKGLKVCLIGNRT